MNQRNDGTNALIGIDARPLSAACKRQGGGGIGTYARELLRAWPRSRAERLALLGVAEDVAACQLPAAVMMLDGTPLLQGALNDHWRAPRTLARAGARVAWYPSQLQAPLHQPLPTVITVHDLIPQKYEELYPADAKERVRQRLMEIACARATQLIAVSTATQRDLTGLWCVPAEKITVIHEAPRPVFCQPVPPAALARVRSAYALPDRFWLYVGGMDPRKTLAVALAGAGTLPVEQRLPWLILAGNREAGAETALLAAARTAGVAVRIAGPVPEADLPGLYAAATALVMPTRDEGCSLPVLDALAAGLPVIASAAGAIPEMAGAAYHPVHEETAAAWGAAMAAVSDPNRQAQLRIAGPQQVAPLSWEKAATATAAILQQAIRRVKNGDGA
ncbi:MAG TPA: glycosyltransferase family 1 protein [bacterium]|nr:glycosyltransferase family 1 protein [bacterium]